jgi:hypothetical protein
MALVSGRECTNLMIQSSNVRLYSPACVNSSADTCIIHAVPTLPAPRGSARHRGEETPSHPGGLSEVARQRLDEHRKKQQEERRRGKWRAVLYALYV